MVPDCCETCSKFSLSLPGKRIKIHPGDVVILDRFSTVQWKVGFGWFSYDGNRKICGWYLVQIDDKNKIKPIQDIDLVDVYAIQSM